MILEVQNGCFGYPKQPVILENINLSLEEGHILAILGPNGIGKTTLLKCMIGLLPWHSGKTLLYGKDIHTRPMSSLGQLFSQINLKKAQKNKPHKAFNRFCEPICAL